ncbi:MAG: hypothetical protein COB50_01420, partial [Thiotrichales bacterium]
SVLDSLSAFEKYIYRHIKLSDDAKLSFSKLKKLASKRESFEKSFLLHSDHWIPILYYHCSRGYKGYEGRMGEDLKADDKVVQFKVDLEAKLDKVGIRLLRDTVSDHELLNPALHPHMQKKELGIRHSYNTIGTLPEDKNEMTKCKANDKHLSSLPEYVDTVTHEFMRYPNTDRYGATYDVQTFNKRFKNDKCNLKTKLEKNPNSKEKFVYRSLNNAPLNIPELPELYDELGTDIVLNRFLLNEMIDIGEFVNTWRLTHGKLVTARVIENIHETICTLNIPDRTEQKDCEYEKLLQKVCANIKDEFENKYKMGFLTNQYEHIEKCRSIRKSFFGCDPEKKDEKKNDVSSIVKKDKEENHLTEDQFTRIMYSIFGFNPQIFSDLLQRYLSLDITPIAVGPKWKTEWKVDKTKKLHAKIKFIALLSKYYDDNKNRNKLLGSRAKMPEKSVKIISEYCGNNRPELTGLLSRHNITLKNNTVDITVEQLREIKDFEITKIKTKSGNLTLNDINGATTFKKRPPGHHYFMHDKSLTIYYNRMGEFVPEYYKGPYGKLLRQKIIKSPFGRNFDFNVLKSHGRVYTKKDSNGVKHQYIRDPVTNVRFEMNNKLYLSKDSDFYKGLNRFVNSDKNDVLNYANQPMELFETIRRFERLVTEADIAYEKYRAQQLPKINAFLKGGKFFNSKPCAIFWSTQFKHKKHALDVGEVSIEDGNNITRKYQVPEVVACLLWSGYDAFILNNDSVAYNYKETIAHYEYTRNNAVAVDKLGKIWKSTWIAQTIKDSTRAYSTKLLFNTSIPLVELAKLDIYRLVKEYPKMFLCTLATTKFSRDKDKRQREIIKIAKAYRVPTSIFDNSDSDNDNVEFYDLHMTGRFDKE